MAQRLDLTPEERAPITEIQDLLIERFVAPPRSRWGIDGSRSTDLPSGAGGLTGGHVRQRCRRPLTDAVRESGERVTN
jgi:hypothetical protein